MVVMKKIIALVASVAVTSCAAPPDGMMGRDDEMSQVRIYVRLAEPTSGIRVGITDRLPGQVPGALFVPPSCDVSAAAFNERRVQSMTCLFRWPKDTSFDFEVHVFDEAGQANICSSLRQTRAFITVERDNVQVGYDLAPDGTHCHVN
jgi:hypothetical protein